MLGIGHWSGLGLGRSTSFISMIDFLYFCHTVKRYCYSSLSNSYTHVNACCYNKVGDAGCNIQFSSTAQYIVGLEYGVCAQIYATKREKRWHKQKKLESQSQNKHSGTN